MRDTKSRVDCAGDAVTAGQTATFSMKNGPYTLVAAPQGYPGKRYRGKYAYEHHVVWWQNTGVIPDPKSVVHHKNENKRDNRFTNLEMITRSEHTAHHNVPAPTMVLPCSECGEQFELLVRNHRFKAKCGQTVFYCSKSCQVSAQQKARWRRVRAHRDRLLRIKLSTGL